MSENINNLRRLREVRNTLVESNVSERSIGAIEKALRNGLVFRRAADLAILNLPPADVAIVETAVTFGTPAPEANVKTLEYTFVPDGAAEDFVGYQFFISYINRDNFSVSESYPIEDSRIVYVDLDLNDIASGTSVVYRVKAPAGDYALIALGNPQNSPTEPLIEVANTALASTKIKVGVIAVETAGNPEANASYQVKGKLISAKNDKTDGYQVVLMAATTQTNGVPDFFPVAYAITETNGYFLTGFLIFNDPADIGRLIAAKSVVSKDDKVWERPIQLHSVELAGIDTVVKKYIPRRLIIVIEEDLGDPATGPDDECGCGDLNFHEKKTLEEYSYYTVVRTTEPAIIADTLEEQDEVDLDDIYGTRTGVKVPLTVFKKYHVALNTQVKAMAMPMAPMERTVPDAGTSGGTGMVARTLNPAIGHAFNKDLLDQIIVDTKVAEQLKGKKKRQFKGRSYLTPLNQIDWDDEPTIYQAASVAHGHLLHFKQEWRPDGYSIGDLMYSLPLAPGQKKQIAVLDWERRESAANSQSLDYEESLNNTLIRDRDISEVINATLNENIRATSKATTSGWGFGMGGAVMGVFNGGSYGALHGISGGKSSSGSTASQNAHRDSTASSLQSISDRTTQAASSVRSQRATVIQTVSQGERVQATAESVANYNHCHAITIQYFEVLRHFSVHTRLSDVQECLFIPLHITSFDLEKCLRWRSTLEACLARPSLSKGFDAILRILKEKENAEDYYTSIGFPKSYFAEQPMKAMSGALFMEFTFFNTQEGKVSDDLVKLLRVFGIPINANEYNDRYISNSELADMVGPRAIEFLLNSIVIETDKGTNLRLDLTLLNRFRQNALLQVSLRQSAATPTTIRRDLVNGIKIRLDSSKLSTENRDALTQFGNKFMKITIRSGSLRYRSDSMSQLLFSGSIDNDLFADGDAVYIDTPLNGEELRNPRGEDVDAANKLLQHLNENLEYYHKCIWCCMTAERRYMLLDGITAPGKANGRSVASVVENRLIGIAGNSLIMPVAPGNQLDPTIDEEFHLFEQYYSEENDPLRVSLPTKGVYAESVMGKCNACEEKDETRFWRWEESPIPDSPNTQILPLDTGTRRADPGNLQAKDFPQPIVNVQNAPNLPDPTGLQAMLQLIGKGDSFRDLTGLNQNQLNALATFQKTLDTATAFGKEAAELAKAAGAMKLVEEGKKSGVVKNEDASKQGNAILEDLQKDPNASRLKQGIELLDQLKKEKKISDADAEAAKAKLLKDFQDSSNAKTSMANEEIGKLADKSKETNKDISVRRPGGETVDIKNPAVEGPSSAVPGAAGLILDMVSTGGKLKFLPTGETAAIDPTPAQLQIIADKDGWVPTRMSDYLNLAVSGRLIGLGTFTAVLNYLALIPSGSVQTLNLACHCPEYLLLAFKRDFVFSEQTGKTTPADPDPHAGLLEEVTVSELIQLNEKGSFEIEEGMVVQISKVRAAFAADAEIRLFAIGGGASEQFAQALANLLQVKVLAFTDGRIQFRIEVIANADPDGKPVLAKRILVTPRFSSGPPFVFNNFEQMVSEDAAKTGKVIALPQRP
jgi:hypothetical protein